MNNARKARLKAKGWRTGSAGDFLGLSPEESYFVELKLRLADDLKLRRTKRRISQEQLAVLVGSSQSRIAKMERGDGPGMRPTIRAEELPMSSVTVEIPESLAALMKGLPIEQMTYEAIVLDLYRRATISSGKAAELLGLGHIEFIKSAGKLGIPYIQMSPEELAAEIAAAKSL